MQNWGLAESWKFSRNRGNLMQFRNCKAVFTKQKPIDKI